MDSLASSRTILAGLGLAASLAAQSTPDDLESLLDIKVEIASRRSQQAKRAPSIVSVVTRAEIERYGWRDLSDILRSLPGFEFGHDGTKLVGLIERGIWAHEGKALIMVDGITISPLHNGNVNYLGSGLIPGELIERVEVIRGPGSSVYGQFAGVAVINVITRRPQGLNGGRAVVRATTLGAGDSGQGIYFTSCAETREGVAMSLSGGFQTTPFSRKPYTDTFFTGKTFPQDKGNTRGESSYLTGQVSALGTTLSFVRIARQDAQVDENGTGPRDPEVAGLELGTLGTLGRTVQALKIRRSDAILPAWTVESWIEGIQNTGGALFPQSKTSSGVNHTGTERSRFTADVALRWTPSFPGVLLLGGGYQHDWERSVSLENKGAMWDLADPAKRLAQVTLQTTYGYMEYSHQLGDFGVTAGARYQDDRLNHAFAPRFGVTYFLGDFNAKLLYQEAFREPTLFQTYSTFFSFRGVLKPELIRTTELELGWRITPTLSGQINLYRLAVTRAISFALDDYDFFIVNAGAMRAKGVEASLELKESDWGGFANIAYTLPEAGSDPFYLSGDQQHFLSAASFKLNAGAHVKLGAIQLAPSLHYISRREAQTPRSAQSGIPPWSLLPNVTESAPIPARVLIDLNVTWKDCLGPNTEARLGVQNITNVDHPVLQPYYGGHAPLPTYDRRVTADLVWRF